jgi:tripartite-type tricarboxylate transporter receptor subunit TctC
MVRHAARRIRRTAYAMLSFTLLAGAAGAQPYPAKPIRMIVPNAPAGLADISARIVATKLSETLGQQVVVDNRAGAGSTIGTAMAVKAPADGYTLLTVFDSHATNPHLFKKLEYDTFKDLAPIALLVRGPLLLAVHPKTGVKSAQELVQLAKTRAGDVKFASVGPGSPARLLMEMLKVEARIDVINVPYKGAGGAVTDLIGGQVDAMFATIPTLLPHIKAGRLNALAITSPKRSAVMLGVATMNEHIPGFVAESWVGMLAPAKTPPAVIARLNGDVVSILAQPEIRARFAELGYETVGSTTAQFDQWIRSETERWGKLIRAQKITLD